MALAHALVAGLLAAAGPVKLALLPLTAGENVTDKTAEALTQAVSGEVRRKGGIQLMTQQEISALVSVDRQKQMLACGNDSCLSEIAGALDVDRLVMGSVARLGESFLLNLQMVDARKATTMAHSMRRKRGGNIDDVLDTLPSMVEELFDKAPVPVQTLAAVEPAPAPTKEPSLPMPAAPAPVLPAAAPPPPGPALPANISPVADVPFTEKLTPTRFALLSDGKRYLAVVPFGGSSAPLFVGDGKGFWQQRVFGGGSEANKSFSLNFWEPRAASPSEASIDYRLGKYTLTCGKTESVFKLVAAESSRPLLLNAKFFKPRWQRRAYALARDDEGTYYYVDQAREPEQNTDFRLYIGNKGRLKGQIAETLASDADGDVLKVNEGKLRLSRTDKEAVWTDKKGEKSKLKYLPVEDNAPFIYGQLGAYGTHPLGTPCDGSL